MNISTVKDFTPTKEQISLHGLGFIQVKLPDNQRLHVWHPELPRRSCFEYSAIHNHRFKFSSRVLAGVQVNQKAMVRYVDRGTHDVISHDGPRSPKGGRLSYVAGQADVLLLHKHYYEPGQLYVMEQLDYHCTPNDGVVITLMKKLSETHEVHANSLILQGHSFDQDFDRFQLSEDELWAFVVDAFKQSGAASLTPVGAAVPEPAVDGGADG